MEKLEIEQLKETVAEDSLEKVDHILEGDAVADMAEGAGWKIMLKKANKKLVELLEPIPTKEITSETELALIGAMAIARSEKIEILRWFVQEAESEKNARREALRKQEESKVAE